MYRKVLIGCAALCLLFAADGFGQNKPAYCQVAEYYAPEMYQDVDVGTTPEGDLIVKANGDGDWTMTNNWDNLLLLYDPYNAWVYYQAWETDSHYFISYQFFHPRDDKTLGSHENDMEGIVIVAKKDGTLFNGLEYGSLKVMETLAHDTYYQYSTSGSGVTTAADNIDATILLTSTIFGPEHPRLYIESKGHGVCAHEPFLYCNGAFMGPGGPNSDFPGGDGLIYSYTGVATSPPTNYGDNPVAGYALWSFLNDMWPYRLNTLNGNIDTTPTEIIYDQFYDYVPAGGRPDIPLALTRADGTISGAFDGDSPGNDNAKPPWGQAAGNGPVNKGMWGIDPAYVFSVRLNFNDPAYSLNYIANPYLGMFSLPTPSLATPNTVYAGDVSRIITISGDEFDCDFQMALSSSGITINSQTLGDANTIILDISISGGAPLGYRDMTITNLDSGNATGFSLLLVRGYAIADAGIDQNLVVGNSGQLDGTGSSNPNPPGTVNYSWTQVTGPAPMLLNDTSIPQPTFDATFEGTYTYRLFVDDGIRTSTPDFVDVIVSPVPSNTAPILNAIPNQAVDEGTLITFTASASDDGLPDPPAALSYSLGPGAPAGAAIGPVTGVFTWTPTEAQGPGTYQVDVIVSDSEFTDNQLVDIDVAEVNLPPDQALIGARTAEEGVLISFLVTATDPDLPANTLTMTASPLPGGSTYVDNGDGTARFSWTPIIGDAGSYDITFTTSDGSAPDAELATITVDPEKTGAGCVPGLMLCYGESDGTPGVSLPEVNAARNMALLKPADYSLVYPNNGDTAEVDGTGFIDLTDVNIARDWSLLRANPSAVTGTPAVVNRVQPVGPINISVGDTVKVYVEILSDATYNQPRSGIGVVFEVISGNAALMGGDGDANAYVDPDTGLNYLVGTKWDTTGTIGSGGIAAITLRADGAGTIILRARVPKEATKQLNATIFSDVTIQAN